MSIYVGTSEIKNIYVGTTPVKEVYVGTTKVRPSITPITTAGIYWSSSLGLISVSGNGSTWITLADKNLGATTVYNYGDTLSAANSGYFYQRGNNNGFPFSGPSLKNTTQRDTTGYGPGNYYSSIVYYVGTASDWSSSTNNDLWGGETGTNAAMQGPCPSGYHIPSQADCRALSDAYFAAGIVYTGTMATDVITYLKLPPAGLFYNSSNNVSINSRGTWAKYWSATSNGNNVFYLAVGGKCYHQPTTSERKACGAPIRPFKNEAVQPDSTWTKLF